MKPNFFGSMRSKLIAIVLGIIVMLLACVALMSANSGIERVLGVKEFLSVNASVRPPLEIVGIVLFLTGIAFFAYGFWPPKRH
jgi:hypothetical protein